MILYFLFALASVWVVAIWILCIGSDFSKKRREPNAQPTVSILISVRNEEHNLRQLMRSLSRLSYPKDKFEIIIGDDDSTDDSVRLIKELLPLNGQLFEFRDHQSNGKQFVLSQLATLSNSRFLLFTDADMSFNRDWIQGMVQDADHSLKVGMTTVRTNGLFSKMESMDWLFHQTIVAFFSRLGFAITAWGNNMIIDRELYFKIGGFEMLESSIVEDVNLMRAVVASGGQVRVELSKEVRATTESNVSIPDLLHQRKRWMSGLDKVPSLLKISVLIKLLYLPAIVMVAWSNPWFWIIPIIKIIGSMVLFYKVSNVSLVRFRVMDFLLYEFYDFGFYLITFAFYILPIPVRWKGRSYH